MPKRRANDNVVIVKEMVHMLSQRHRKKNFCAIELDGHKAYDIISWALFESCLKRLGFSNPNMERIMHCISSIFF